MSFQPDTLMASIDGCGKMLCVAIRVITFRTSAHRNVPKAMQDSLHKVLFANPYGDSTTPATFDALRDSTMMAYRQFRTSMPDVPKYWSLYRCVDVTKPTPRFPFLVFRLTTLDDLGGAHPSMMLQSMVYTPTGEEVGLDHVLIPGYEQKLVDIVTTYVRRVRNIKRNISLEKAGLWLVDGRLPLAKTWYPTDRGLVFVYNTYEIAPYAAGPTEVVIPWKRISHLLRGR